MKTEKSSSMPYAKKMVMDVIKVLLFLVVFSTLFHDHLVKIVDSISDFAFHHYLITSFLVLVVLAIAIEFDVFHGDHINNIKKKLKK